ncbi:MAG TPA: hypothetical protein VJ986_09245 [Gaiellaceae bacterium]|nr:hypothetical protein [Gaiellaceae bacterium]
MVTNDERAFAERPEVYAARGELNGAIKAGMDLRRYELVTLAAAARCFFSKTLDALVVDRPIADA